MEPDKDQLQAKIESVHQELVDAYGLPQRRNPSPPLDTLIGAILSQNTSDVNSHRAYEHLRQRFPDWAQVRDAPTEDVIETIRSAGLANLKGPRIQQVLRRISDERGELSLDFLADAPLDEAQAWLTDLNGVGPKTAAIVLLFSLGRPAFPVDTHVHRVSRRLGLIPERTSAEKAHTLLEARLPHDWYYPFHMNLVRHGRQVCHARNPNCEECILPDLCDYYRLVYGTATSEP
jgi:endonuclease-3